MIKAFSLFSFCTELGEEPKPVSGKSRPPSSLIQNWPGEFYKNIRIFIACKLRTLIIAQTIFPNLSSCVKKSIMIKKTNFK